MNRSPIIIGACVALCLGICACLFLQHGRLAELRAEHKRLLASQSSQAVEPIAAEPAAGLSPEMSELLRLRNQVSQLRLQKTGLDVARAENERLHAQLASLSAKSNSNTAVLPPDYIRRRDAQWMGAGSIQNTVQSFLWAIQNRDITNLVRVMTPESGEKILAGSGGSADKLFDEASVIPGMRVVSQETQPDGSIKAKIEIMPGQSMGEETLRFRHIDGEWKMDMH